MVVAKVMLVVGAGAVTVNDMVSPVFIEVDEKLFVAAAVKAVPLSEMAENPKFAVIAVTLKSTATVVPAASAASVAVPAPVPVIVTTSFPLISVTEPEAGETVKVPVPDPVSVTGVLVTGTPAEFKTVKVTA